MTEDKEIPITISEAVNRLLSNLSIEVKHQIKNSTEEGLINFHFGIGMSIRNDFGFWEKESKLLENCKKIAGDSLIDVDTASEMIIKTLWERLKEYPPPKIVQGSDDCRY